MPRHAARPAADGTESRARPHGWSGCFGRHRL